ncbi:MAG: ubiquinol-cytochrome C chaperone family protein, partial [Pseudomonadota bacterium]|nr:ubiquinol-cytochrome C chaperone family protein [Pseudomonadota bacterium]
IKQSRVIMFYQEFGVPDTANGRFDLISLHAYVIMRRLKNLGEDQGKLSQALFDLMFSDIDKNLREMGVGDLAVGRRVKKLVAAFYGRIRSYDDGLKGGNNELRDALERNIYLDSGATTGQILLMVKYLQAQVMESDRWSYSSINNSTFSFISPDLEMGANSGR